MNARRVRLCLALASSGFMLSLLLMALSPHLGATRAVASGSSSVAQDDALPLSPGCSSPVVLSGSIIGGVNPTMMGRLIRNGIQSTCGKRRACAGVQNTSMSFSYEAFHLANASPDWQCVHVTLNTASCAQSVYSAAYLDPFNPADLCQNNIGEMGFSTASVNGYSFMVPPNSSFSIVNNTIGTSPPSSDCASYVMTVTLCSADYAVTVTKRAYGPSTVMADATGRAVVPMEVVFENSGSYTAQVDAALNSETVLIHGLDGAPAVMEVNMGRAGAILPPGKTVVEYVPLEFSGSQFACLPRTYEVSSQLGMVAGVYTCNGFNPPSAEGYAGAVSRDASLGEDSIAFQSLPGTVITVTVDTQSLETAFDIEACVSGTPQGECLAGLQGNDNFRCTFSPPAGACPRFGGVLPGDPDGDNMYYLRVNSGSSSFAGPMGYYHAVLQVMSGPIGACPMLLVIDNGSRSFTVRDDLIPSSGLLDGVATSSVAATAYDILAATSVTATVNAVVSPVRIIVPPANAGGPGCGRQILPLVLK